MTKNILAKLRARLALLFFTITVVAGSFFLPAPASAEWCRIKIKDVSGFECVRTVESFQNEFPDLAGQNGLSICQNGFTRKMEQMEREGSGPAWLPSFVSRLAGRRWRNVVESIGCVPNETDCNNPDAPPCSGVRQPGSTNFKAPDLEIGVPGLKFTEEITAGTAVDSQGDEYQYLSLPWIGEYLAAMYKWAVAVASIVAVVMIIVQAIRIIISGGGEGKVEGYKRIGQIVIGLIIAWESYAILYFVNPDLVSFKSLTVRYVEGIPLFGPGTGEEQSVPAGGEWANGITNYTITDQCFPVKSSALKFVSWNWGDDRANGSRCHAGIDIYTQNEAEVVALDDGVVTNKYHFHKCSGGPSDAILIYHQKIAATVLYGEINSDTIPRSISIGQSIKKGDYLGKASKCGMLHLETYRGKTNRNNRWLPPNGQSTIGNSKCAREFLRTKPNDLLDPTNLMKTLQEKFCP